MIKKIRIYWLLGILILPLLGNSQLYTINGIVTESENGKAIESVNVFEPNSKIGTISNTDGMFKLELNKGELNLEISNDGFKSISQNFILKSDTTIFIAMIAETQNRSKQRKVALFTARENTAKNSSNK